MTSPALQRRVAEAIEAASQKKSAVRKKAVPDDAAEKAEADFVRRAAKRVLDRTEPVSVEPKSIWDDCPRCKARMAKQVEANRRWREKRGGK